MEKIYYLSIRESLESPGMRKGGRILKMAGARRYEGKARIIRGRAKIESCKKTKITKKTPGARLGT